MGIGDTGPMSLYAPILESRSFFLRHVATCPEALADWAPNEACRSIRQVMVHLLAGDEVILRELLGDEAVAGEAIDAQFEREHGRDPLDALCVRLRASSEYVVDQLRTRYGEEAASVMVQLFGTPGTLSHHLRHFGDEDHYHAGQVVLLRLAQDPAWDPMADVYGG